MLKIYFVVTLLTVAVLSMPTEDIVDTTNLCNYKGFYFKPGEYVPGPIGECIKIKCSDPVTHNLAKLTCPKSIPPPGCRKTEKDLTKPYPKCCPKTICPDDLTTQT